MTGTCGVQRSSLLPQFVVTLRAVPAPVPSGVGGQGVAEAPVETMAGTPILLPPSPFMSPPHLASPINLPCANLQF